MQFRGTSMRISINGYELTALAQAEGFRSPAQDTCGVPEVGLRV